MSNLSFKNLSYVFIILVSYLIGDSEIPEIAYKKIFGNEVVNVVKEVGILPKNINNDRIYPFGKFVVIAVVDGDTIKVRNETGQYDTVRLLAVNTLEMNSVDITEKCFAKKQTQFTKDKLLNTTVFLFGDKTQTERDKYGRILAYVSTTLEHGNYFFNNVLVETGNANIYRASPPAVMFDTYDNLTENAKSNKIGMWSNVCN